MSHPTCGDCVSDDEKWRYVEEAHQLSSGLITVWDDSKKWDEAIQRCENSPRLVIGKDVTDNELARLLTLRTEFAELRVCDLSDKRTAVPRDAWIKVRELRVCLAEWTAADLEVFVNGFDEGHRQIVESWLNKSAFGVFESVLQKLDISGCVKVKSLPELGMFQNLKELNVCQTVIMTTLSDNFSYGNEGKALERICFSLVEGKKDLYDYLPKNVKPKKLEVHYTAESGEPVADGKEVTTVNLSGLSALSGLVSLRFVNNTSKAVKLADQVWDDIGRALSKSFEDLFLVGVQLDEKKIKLLEKFSRKLVSSGRTRGFDTLHLEGCTWNGQSSEGEDEDYETARAVESEVAACLGSKMNASNLEFVECAFIGNELAEGMWSRGQNPRINNFKMWWCWNTDKMFPPRYGKPQRHKMPSLKKLALDPCPLDDSELVASIQACKSLQSLTIGSVKAGLYTALQKLVQEAKIESLGLHIVYADFGLVFSLVQTCPSLKTLELPYMTKFTLAQWYEVLQEAERRGCQVVFKLPTNVRPYKP